MRDVTLWCRVYGLGLTFRVQIARDAYVDTLKETIVDSHKALDPRFNVNPAGVTLYLAKKKDGTWLTDDDDLDVLLKRGRPQQDAEDDFVEMIPNWKLSKNAYFGRRFQLEEDSDDAEDEEEAKIHIVVELPAPIGSAVASGAQDIKAIIHETLDERERRESVHSLSQLDSEHGQRIMTKLRLREQYFRTSEPIDKSIPEYQWPPEAEDGQASQRASFVAYLQQHLMARLDQEKLELADVADDKALLTVKDPRLPFRLTGTTDLLVRQKVYKPLNKLAGIRLAIAIKKTVDATTIFPEALGQLTSCSLKAPMNCYPLCLVTDLNNTWVFLWFGEGGVVANTTLQYPKNAIDFIVAAVGDSVEFPTPFLKLKEGAPPLKKLKVDDFRPMPSDGADEMMERWELMADELEPEFLEGRRVKYAQHLVQRMPAFAHLFS